MAQRFKDIITMVKRYHGIETIEPSIMMQMMSIIIIGPLLKDRLKTLISDSDSHFQPILYQQEI